MYVVVLWKTTPCDAGSFRIYRMYIGRGRCFVTPNDSVLCAHFPGQNVLRLARCKYCDVAINIMCGKILRHIFSIFHMGFAFIGLICLKWNCVWRDYLLLCLCLWIMFCMKNISYIILLSKCYLS